MIPKLQLCRDSSVHDRVVKEASFIPNFWSPQFLMPARIILTLKCLEMSSAWWHWSVIAATQEDHKFYLSRVSSNWHDQQSKTLFQEKVIK